MIKKKSDKSYREAVIQTTKSIDYLNNFNAGQSIYWLSQEIYDGKKKLNYNSVDFIVAKLLDRRGELINYKGKEFINLYIIGTFKNDFIPTYKVAQALATFYMEMKVIPNLITITKKEFISDPQIITRLKNGILIYDRERNLH